MRTTLTAAFTAVATTAALVSGAAPAATATPAPAAPAPLAWGPCPDTVTTPGATCAPLSVPLDYADPGGTRIDVTVSRLPARDPAQRKGVLLGNSGGPGGDALTYFDDNEVFRWPEQLRREWDLVAVQPRGLPHATPLRCAPVDPGDMLAMTTNAGGTLRAACEAGSPGLARHLTTENTARDWEEARRALGVESVSVLGLSYGTILGSTYATLFPERVDKLVLDSGVGPDWQWSEVLARQNEPYKQRTHAMFAWIAERDDVYHLGTTPLQVYQRWSDRVVAESGVNPTLAPPPAAVGDVPPAWRALARQYMDGVTLTGPLRVQAENLARAMATPGAVQLLSPMLGATRAAAPRSVLWPKIAESLRDGKRIGQKEPTMSDIPEEALISMTMQQLVLCNENTVPPRPLDYPAFLWAALITGDIYELPPFTYSSGAACAGAPPVTRPVALTGEHLRHRPLLLNGTGDPQTPLEGALDLGRRMNAEVVTVESGDHGQFAKGNAEVDARVLEYLRS